MTGIVVPGKLYGVMAAGRPAIFVGPEHCESADTIRDAGCGFTITPGDADGLVAALSLLAVRPESRLAAWANGDARRSSTAPRTKTLLQPLARADRRTGRSTGNSQPAAIGRTGTAAAHASSTAAPLRHRVSVSRCARDRPATRPADLS